VITLTCPRIRVISNIKWEVNITKKYSTESSAMVLRIVGILSFIAFDSLIARTMINENVRKSNIYAYHQQGQLK
jgi:hypothetical protein